MKLYKETLIFTRLLKNLAGLLPLSPDLRISDILWFSLGKEMAYRNWLHSSLIYQFYGLL